MNRLSKFIILKPKHRLDMLQKIIANRFCAETKLELKNEQSTETLNSTSTDRSNVRHPVKKQNNSDNIIFRGDRNYENKRKNPQVNRKKNPYDRVEDPFDPNEVLDKTKWLHRYGRRRHQHGTEVFNFFKTHEHRQGKKQESIIP